MPRAERRILAGPRSTWPYRGLLASSLVGLLLVGVAGRSAASPGLGPRGWAPGTLGLHLSAAAVTALLWAAYLLGAAAVALALRRGSRLPVPSGAWVAALAVAALLTSPFGSADHTNYAAYGRIAAQGGDPYAVPPVAWAGGSDPVTRAVEAPWTRTPSIYGPLATALQALCSWVAGDNLRQSVWLWQLLVVTAWLGARALLLRLAGSEAQRRRVEVLWTWNPLLVGVAVLGAHVDVLATALAVAAVAVAAPRRPWAAGGLVGLTVSTKVTYAVVVLALLWSWRGRPRPELLRRVAVLLAAALAVALPLHLWAGPHVFEQLLRARRSVSLATPWRLVVELLTGPLASATVRSLVSVGAVVVAAVLVAALSRWVRPSGVASEPAEPAGETASAVRATFVLGTACVLAAPYSLPWYDTLTWATLPLVLARPPLDGILLGRFTVMALAYVPGRVLDLTPGVQTFTLGVRRQIAPYAGLLTWVLLATLARRRWRGPARPGHGPSAGEAAGSSPHEPWPQRRPRPRAPAR